jgi:hypothetical protein
MNRHTFLLGFAAGVMALIASTGASLAVWSWHLDRKAAA